MIYTSEVFDQLRKHEGFRGKPYKDTKGFLTVCYGWNLEENDIPEEVGRLLLDIALRRTIKNMKAHPRLAWLFIDGSIDQIRLDVFINMAYNMGPWGLAKFSAALEAAKECDYEKAADELKDSKWWDQVGDGEGGIFDRAEELALQMRTGVRQTRG